jgi:outer membrane immunogenic protein
MNNTSIRISKRLILAILTLMIAATISIQAQEGQTYSSQGPNPVSDKSLNGKIIEKISFSAKEANAAPPAAGTHDWTGGYIGGHLGYGWGKGDTRFEPLPTAAAFINLQPQTLRVRPRGILGGGQAGYNWQFGHVVVGAEGSLSVSNIKKTTIVSPIIQNNGTPFAGAGFLSASQKIKWLGSLRPRIGGAFGKVFVYGTVGFAFARINYAATTDFRPVGTTQYPATVSSNRKGWTAGGGVEVAVAKKWSVKGEYLYYDFGSTSATVGATPALPPFQVMYTWQTKLHTFSGGVNYHF